MLLLDQDSSTKKGGSSPTVATIKNKKESDESRS